MFIVSLPFAVFHGGYWAILAMVGIAYICCYTGKILVDCLYETNEYGEKTKVRYSYNEVAQVGISYWLFENMLFSCMKKNSIKNKKIDISLFCYIDIKLQVVFGKQVGGKIINAAQLIELLMTCILYVVLCGDLFIGAFPYGQIDTR